MHNSKFEFLTIPGVTSQTFHIADANFLPWSSNFETIFYFDKISEPVRWHEWSLNYYNVAFIKVPITEGHSIRSL